MRGKNLDADEFEAVLVACKALAVRYAVARNELPRRSVLNYVRCARRRSQNADRHHYLLLSWTSLSPPATRPKRCG